MTKKILSAEDLALFRSTVGEVEPVVSNHVLLQSETKPRPVPLPKLLEQVAPLNEKTDFALQMVYQEDRLSFIAAGLQKNVLRKLRKGYFGLDAEIDLHGLNRTQAKQQLLRFLHDCVEDGCRCVHIVHGKGYRSPDSQPVLKNDVNLWLRQHQDVLAFCSASPKHGGAGAVLVLLKLAEKYDSLE